MLITPNTTLSYIFRTHDCVRALLGWAVGADEIEVQPGITVADFASEHGLDVEDLIEDIRNEISDDDDVDDDSEESETWGGGSSDEDDAPVDFDDDDEYGFDDEDEDEDRVDVDVDSVGLDDDF